MTVSKSVALAAAALSLGSALAAATPANAKDICGWYAIIYCSPSEAGAISANKGWGSMIHTSAYRGFAPNRFCLGSGPQPKWSARLDRERALNSGVAKSAYIKYACTDSSNLDE
jgi:hypothetical protein